METLIKSILVFFTAFICLMSISYPIRHDNENAVTETLCGILFVIAVWLLLKGVN